MGIIGCTSHILGLSLKIYKSICDISPIGNEQFSLIDGNTKFWIIAAIVTGIWVYFSGIGGFSYQNDDYWVRNPIFHDLSTIKWPVIYDLSKEPSAVQAICGNSKVAFAYYFCWWLPVSLITKILSLSDFSMNVLLLMWAWFGVMLVVYLLCRTLKKCSYVALFLLIGFSGMDAVVYIMRNNIFEITPWTTHIEWWADVFQYSSMTTQLYWVFNQTIPIWLIVALMLQLNDVKCHAGLISLAFAYSPWATFGLVPYSIYASIKSKARLRQSINIFNIVVPIIMLIIFGTFFTSGTGSTGMNGLVFTFNRGNIKMVIANYILFVFLEFGIYYIIMGKDAVKNEFYIITILELIIIPLLVIRDYNFCMRASIPALFITMFYILRYLLDNEVIKTPINKISKRILIVLLLIGMLTPLSEINRSINKTTTEKNITVDPIGSFANMMTEKEHLISTAKDQFFVYDYENALFFKYFGKSIN